MAGEPQTQTGSSVTIEGRPILFEVNRHLDRISVPCDLSEHFIEELLALTDDGTQQQGMVYWLTVARLMEAGLLCAGGYADTCEFRLAGDLLINPRKICVRIKTSGKAFEKLRHSRLTDQLKANGNGRSAESIDRRDVTSDIVAPALLPFLYRRLSMSGYFGNSYLGFVARRMTAIADTVGFLMAGQINSIRELHRYLQEADPTERGFFEHRLCRFEATWFYRFGNHVRRIRKGEAAAYGAEIPEPETDRDSVYGIGR